MHFNMLYFASISFNKLYSNSLEIKCAINTDDQIDTYSAVQRKVVGSVGLAD